VTICSAWSRYDLLNDDQKAAFQELLAAHARFAEDFKVPGNITRADRWKAGRAGYWSDVARRQPNDNQLNWHWEDAVTLVQNGAGVHGRRSFSQMP
jgi:hypothetical protein